MAPDTPPPFLRPDVSERERSQIEALLGPIPDVVLLRAVRDGRGREFQRLEFLGDSVLDVVLAVHRWVEPECATCSQRHSLSEASDRSLAQDAVRAGVGTWLEWRASHERIADVVETCVAACWLTGRWPQSFAFVRAVVHPMRETTLQALTRGISGEPGRVARRVGSALLELASGYGVYRTLPEADEGQLSTARARLHRAAAVAARAREVHHLDGFTFRSRDDETVLSEVEDVLAQTLGASGGDAGLSLAERFVPAHPD